MSFSMLKNNRLLRLLGSVRFAFILFWTLIAVSLIGAVAPEPVQPRIFYSWWFRGVLGCFALNIMLCCLPRLAFSKKRFGSALTHLSVLVILAGALISHLGSVRGVMELQEGQARDSIVTDRAVHRLGFKVALEDFSLQWYADRPEAFAIGVKVADQGFQQEYALALGQVQKVGLTGYSVSVADYMPQFSLGPDGRARNLSAMPLNPAVLVKIAKGGAEERRWVFAMHPQMGAKDKAIKLRFSWKPMVKEFRSTLRVSDEKTGRATTGISKVNAPFLYGGYTFYQAGYDDADLSYTRLDVVRDPGVPLVLTGFILLNAGLLLVFLPKLGLSVLIRRRAR